MRAAVCQDLPGHFGPISSSGIWNRVQNYKLDRIYFDIRQITTEIIDYCTKKSTLAGINIVPSWFNEDLAQAALRTTRKLNELGFVGAKAAAPCPILFDWEEHSIEKTAAGLKAWRATRQKRDTVWSMEPLQGGWVGDRQMREVIVPDKNLILMPQVYRSQMQPVAQDACYKDLLRFYPPGQVKLYYQSFQPYGPSSINYPPPEAWDGCVYDLEHLPL